MTLFENRKLLARVVAAAVIVAVLVGLYVAGSPAEARLMRLDDRRVDDLRSVSGAIADYKRGRGHLPPERDSLPLAIADGGRLHDPVTGAAYSYEITGDSSYSLCATFARPSPAGRDGPYDSAWRHHTGHVCFPLVAPGRP